MKHKKLLILLHGYGANGMDLMPIGDYIKKTVTKFELDYSAPDAFEICDANPYGFQWLNYPDQTILTTRRLRKSQLRFSQI